MSTAIRLTHLRRVLAAVALTCSGVVAEDKPDEKEWIQLFNGKNLDGWAIKIAGYDLNENFGNTTRVENGVLKVAYDQ